MSVTLFLDWLRRIIGGNGVRASLLLSIAIMLVGNANAATVSVFFAGGQSNAKSTWSDAILNTLVDSNRYENVLMISNMHSGNWLYQWFDNGTPQANYQADFFNSTGTGMVQSATNTILAQGNDYKFSGMFWFQGEGDYQDYANSVQRYPERFKGMLGQLDADLGGNTGAVAFELALVDINPDYQSTLPPDAMDKMNIFRQTQIDLANSAPEGYYFDTRGYARSDAYHLTAASLTSVGVGMANNFLAASAPVPVPPSLWLLGSSLLGITSLARRRRR